MKEVNANSENKSDGKADDLINQYYVGNRLV
jgi:hypothetical protein